MNTSRAELRQHFKQQRLSLAAAARAAANTAITHHLSAWFAARPSNGKIMVGAFMATSAEVDLGPWLKSHLAAGEGAALPRIEQGGVMHFHHYTASTTLLPNRFAIAEPAPTSTPVDATDLDVVLVPLVAFDESGTRLGMGGGYYDRYLSGLRPDAKTLGVAFACQQSAEPLPREPWDVPLHAVVTENGVLELA